MRTASAICRRSAGLRTAGSSCSARRRRRRAEGTTEPLAPSVMMPPRRACRRCGRRAGRAARRPRPGGPPACPRGPAPGSRQRNWRSRSRAPRASPGSAIRNWSSAVQSRKLADMPRQDVARILERPDAAPRDVHVGDRLALALRGIGGEQVVERGRILVASSRR